jgi:hypothetical protein
MKPMLNITITTFLLLAAASHCFAETLIEGVTRERAKELGVTVRSQKNGKSVRVWLEFKTDAGKQLMSATLQPSHPSRDSVSVGFSADPSYLPNSALTINVPHGLGGEGYRFRIKDFVDLEKVR